MHASGQHNYPLMLVSILLTALCWGSYGPLLLWGHQAMGSGRLRPFICVGIAYFLIAIVGPILFIYLTGMEKGDGLGSGWNFTGTMWSLAGGAVGAIGAFGIILALNYGGHPTFVMPLVFGIAPVVNTMITIGLSNRWGELSPMYYAGLILVGAGAVTVLLFQPKGPPPKHSAKPAPAVKETAERSVPNDAGEEGMIDPPRKNS